jgi:hypothetical protein
MDHSRFLDWYWLIPISLILAIGVSIYILLMSLNRFILELPFTRKQVIVTSIALTSMYLVSLDAPNETIYWMSGAVTYHLANAVFVLFLAALIHLYFCRSKIRKYLLLAASGVLLAWLIGSNETLLLPTLCFLGLAVVWSYSVKGAHSYTIMLTSLLVLGLVTSLIVILAPGNSLRLQRQEELWGSVIGFHRANSLSEAAQAAIRTTIWEGISILRWLLIDAYHAFALFAALALTAGWMKQQKEPMNSPYFRCLLWLPVICLVLIWLAAWPSFYLGIPPFPRTSSSIYMIFFLAFIPGSVALMKYYGWEFKGTGITRILQAALVLSLLMNSHYTATVHDIKNAVLYRLQLQEREIIVNNATKAGRRDLVVPRLTRVPATIHLWDLSRDESAPYNRCYASYHGLNSISAIGDGDTAHIVQPLRDKTKFLNGVDRILEAVSKAGI